MPERLPVATTRMNYRVLDQKLKSVQKGLTLLKCKSDALQLNVRAVEAQLEGCERSFKELFGAAFRLYSMAELCGTDMRLFTKVCTEAPATVDCEFSSVCGTTVARFTVKRKELDSEVLWKSGYVFKEMRRSFDELLSRAAELATMKSSLAVVKIQLESTNKRKNSLEQKLIPRLEGTIAHIEGELDEMEREEFFRLKKIQKMKDK